jgi:hypothetical protein
MQDHLLTALLWLPGYDWKGKKLVRRLDFPSWSWTGWRGIAGVKPGHEVAKTCNVVKDVENNVETEEGHRKSVLDYVGDTQTGDMPAPRYTRSLHIQGWVTKV